jgi:hypothetical protein
MQSPPKFPKELTMKTTFATLRRIAALLIAFKLLASVASASITMTITAEMFSNDNGGSAFTIGESVTVSFTTISGLGVPNIDNSTTTVEWYRTNDNTDPAFGTPFWSNVTVTGATGSYSATTSEHVSQLQSGDKRDAFYAAVWENVDNGFGLFRGGEEINFIDAFVQPSSLVDAVYNGDSSVTPETTFLNGVYDISGATKAELFIYTDGYSKEYIATINTVTITGAVIPEPAAALPLGFVVLGYVMCRRKKMV